MKVVDELIALGAKRQTLPEGDRFHHEAHGILVIPIALPEAGMWVPQHSHAYDHVTYIARGAVRIFANGKEIGVFREHMGYVIRAGTKHTFEVLEDNSAILCIHNVAATGEVEILEHHEFPGG